MTLKELVYGALDNCHFNGGYISFYGDVKDVAEEMIEYGVTAIPGFYDTTADEMVPHIKEYMVDGLQKIVLVSV